MNKNWIRFSCFVLIFCLCFTMLNQVLAFPWGGWTDFYKLPKNSIDVLFLGNSHSFVSFQPLIIDDLLPVSSYVIGIPGENIIVTYYELKEVLKYQHPKAIVFETFAADLNNDLRKGYLFRFLDAGGWNESKLALIYKYLFPDKLDTLFPVLRTRMEWEKPYLFFHQVESYVNELKSTDIDPKRGSAIGISVITDEDYNNTKKYYDINSAKPLPDNKIFLDKLVALCKENDIQLIFTTTPILGDSSTQYDYSDPMDITGYAEKNNIPRIVFDTSKLVQMHYQNFTHVNTLGSLVLSTDMAIELSKVLGVPVDPKKLEGYQAFTFTGHSITKTNNDYVIKINPADPNSSLLYLWRLVKGGKVLQSKDWQTSSSFHFKLESLGDYEVYFRVKNPSTGYIVGINFPITLGGKQCLDTQRGHCK